MAEEIKKVEEKTAQRAHGASAQAERTSGSASVSEAELIQKGAEEAHAEAPKKRKKKAKKRSLTEANVAIQASYNNTIVTVTERNGNVVCWASAGACGFKGTRKATPYAASVAVENALNKAKLLGVEHIHVSVKGIGSGRDQALRAISASGISIESIADRTAIPHGGCRPRKARRV